jgi:hypothetical protein
MEIGIDGVKWIRLVQVRVQWQAFVITVVNLRVSKERRPLVDKMSNYQHLIGIMSLIR